MLVVVGWILFREVIKMLLRGGKIYDIFFFFNDTATTEIYTLSLHDALPISCCRATSIAATAACCRAPPSEGDRSEEHTSELQSQSNLVCRLLLEKKKIKTPRLLHLEYLRHTLAILACRPSHDSIA